MPSDLAYHIQTTPLCDTHEHLRKEDDYVQNAPDLLQNIFDNYLTADLIVAGASPEALKNLTNRSNPDLRGRFLGIQAAWEAAQFTGYGEAARLIARELYDIDEITVNALERAQSKHATYVQPGQRLHLLRNVANLDHVQTDDFIRPCKVDASGPDFFFYDISWVSFASGRPDLGPLAQETGVEVRDLATLRTAMAAVFAQNAPAAIAVKSQHAYDRTLLWQERSDADAERVLQSYLKNPDGLSEAERLCLGDWSLARGVELAIEHDLPFKIHTGYYAGHSRMPVDYIRAGNLCALLHKYLDARFVLMHTAYPYGEELVALTKHYPNVYVDLCWAWSIDPFSTIDFVRRYLHAVPSNKLFVFGGDTGWPGASLAYAKQARQHLTRCLQTEIDEGYLNERQAITLATRFMRDNQYACFHVAEKKASVANL